MIPSLLARFLRVARHVPFRASPVRSGRLTAIYVAEAAGAPMVALERTLALTERGLAGDRYAADRGFWKPMDGCQVTLILAEDLADAERRRGLPAGDGRHRRNLVIAGLRGIELRGRRLRIGEALFEWHRVRPPCGYLDRIAGPGTAKALGRTGGHCLKVRDGGPIQVGDRVILE